MARKRMIDPELWSDEKVQNLKDIRSELLYLGTISQADDSGRLEWSARQLLARVFPGREEIKIQHIEAWMSDIEAVGLVRVYEVAGRKYAVHPNWRRHQTMKKPQPSRIPGPDPEEGATLRFFPLSSEPSTELSTEPSSEPGTELSSEPSSHQIEREENRKGLTSVDLSAWAILDACWPVITTHVDVALKREAWRKRNKRAALELVDANKTPEQCAAKLLLAFEDATLSRFYGHIVMLDDLVKWWPRLVPQKSQPEPRTLHSVATVL